MAKRDDDPNRLENLDPNQKSSTVRPAPIPVIEDVTPTTPTVLHSGLELDDFENSFGYTHGVDTADLRYLLSTVADVVKHATETKFRYAYHIVTGELRQIN